MNLSWLIDFLRIYRARRWFSLHVRMLAADGKNVPYPLDRQQLAAVVDNHDNTLLRARAGSGKTHVLAAKLVYLIAHEGIKPSEITAFVFNRSAATEINQRLANIFVDGQPVIKPHVRPAQTFHAFALKIVKSADKIEPKVLVGDEQERTIRLIIKQRIDTSQQEKTWWENRSRLERLVSQFINRAEQKFGGDHEKLRVLCQGNAPGKEGDFLKDSFTVFDEYLRHTTGEGSRDFNVLMQQAAHAINSGHAPKRLNKYRFLLVDEYQDFSKLFFEMLTSIRGVAPQAKLFCVGDDWQMINRFAGSDEDYFLGFKKLFPSANKQLDLPTNRRSLAGIVDNANHFMFQALTDSKGSKSLKNKRGGEVFLCNLEKILFDPAGDKEYVISSALAEVYGRAPPKPLLRTVKLLDEIFRDNPGKSIMLLHRNNSLTYPGGYDIEKLPKVFQALGHESSQIMPATMHRSKGREADIVVILQADDGIIPSQHPDTELFRIFGDTRETEYRDQAKLFYVAMTRAREKLYICHSDKKLASGEIDTPSGFLALLSPSVRSYQSPIIMTPIMQKIRLGKIRFGKLISLKRTDRKSQRYTALIRHLGYEINLNITLDKSQSASIKKARIPCRIEILSGGLSLQPHLRSTKI